MVGEITSSEIRAVISEDVEEVLKKEVTPFDMRAKVGYPKEHISKTIYLVVCKE